MDRYAADQTVRGWRGGRDRQADSPYGLRHGFNQRCRDAGVPSRDVQAASHIDP
jgi:integrase